MLDHLHTVTFDEMCWSWIATQVEHEQKNIEELTISLRKGENVLVHCWGGSGRTGTVVTGAIKNFQVPNPVKYVCMPDRERWPASHPCTTRSQHSN